MNDCFSKQLALLDDGFSIEEIVLSKSKTLHVQIDLNASTFLYCIHAAAIIYPLDLSLNLIDSSPIVSGQIYNLPNNAKAFLLESLNTSDQDLKILKIVTRK